MRGSRNTEEAGMTNTNCSVVQNISPRVDDNVRIAMSMNLNYTVVTNENIASYMSAPWYLWGTTMGVGGGGVA